MGWLVYACMIAGLWGVMVEWGNEPKIGMGGSTSLGDRKPFRTDYANN